tara:strand:+ start:873 stop:1793 length:921 start_codon:yes stop_codon:yes gene_type:complete
MGYKKPSSCSADKLATAKFPSWGSTYTVIRHKFLIDATRSLLQTHGFNIVNEEYRATGDCNIAQGIYHIESKQDSELGMMFAWTNSYNKQIRFQCGVGAYVFVCNNGMIAGDMASYARKHTGNADSEAFNQITNQIKNANKYFTKLLKDKESMKAVTLSSKEQAELVGRLFIEEELLDSSQVSCIKKEMNKPSYQYGVGQDTGWAFYNHVTHALKLAHPRSWMKHQQTFHEFMIAECLSQSTIQSSDTNNIESDPVNPNQLTLDKAIEEATNEIELPDGRVIDELDAAEPMNEIIIEEEDYDFMID